MKNTPLLKALLDTPLFDPANPDQQSGGLEEIGLLLKIPWREWQDDQEKYAKLIHSKIVKACNAHEELLEALKWALKLVPISGWKPEYEKQFTKEYNAVIALIHKAEGK